MFHPRFDQTVGDPGFYSMVSTELPTQQEGQTSAPRRPAGLYLKKASNTAFQQSVPILNKPHPALPSTTLLPRYCSIDNVPQSEVLRSALRAQTVATTVNLGV